MKKAKFKTKFFIMSVICFTASVLYGQTNYNNTIELRCDGQGDEYISIYAKASPILPSLKYYLASTGPDTWVEQKHKYNNHEMADVPLWTIKAVYEQGDGVFDKYPLLENRNIPAGNHIAYTPCKRTTTGCSVSNKFGDHEKDWDFLVNKLDEILKDAGLDNTSSDWDRAQAVAYWCHKRRKGDADWESPRHPVDFTEMGGMCTYSAHAFVAFCSILEIPARVIRWSHHTCAEAFVDGQWRWVENTIDLCEYMQKQSKYEKGPMFSYSFQEMIADPAKQGLPAGTQYDGFTNLRDDRKNEYHINLEGYTDWVFGWIKGNDKPERLIKIESAYELSGIYPEKETIIYKCLEGEPQMYLTPPGEKTWVFTRHPVKIDQDHGLRQCFYLSSEKGLKTVTSAIYTEEMDVPDDGGNWYYVINGKKVYLRDIGGWNISENRIDYTIPLEYLNFSSVTLEGSDQTYPGKTWETRTPAQVGMDEAKLDAFRDYLGSHGCVVRSGNMIYTWGSQSERDFVFSAEKPWYAHFLWKALEDGKIPSLDQKVNIREPRLNEINADLGYKDRNITWRHLANQTSCYGVRDNPGEAFNYNDYQMALFWDLLFLKVYGVSYENVDSTLLRPMLTDILQCQDNPTFTESGHSSQGSLGVSVRDFARFGLLYLREGNWQGKQLISAEHARTAVSSPLPAALPTSTEELAGVIDGQRTIGRVARVQKQGPHRGSYSWLWWVNGVDHEGNRNWPDAPLDTYLASGGGGNRMAVIPSLNMVAVWLSVEEESRDINHALKLLVESVQSGIKVQGDKFLYNGEPFDMWGIRTASATMNQATTDHLIAQLDDYKAHGVNSVTVYYMGSSGGNWDPFSSDGKSIDSGHQDRMKQIIEACAARNMVVIVGIFYQNSPFGLKDAEAVRNAVRTVTASLKPYNNVIINIANEQNSKNWEDSAEIYDFRKASSIIGLCRIVHQENPDRLVGGGGYDHDKNEIIGKSSDVDILLFDTAGDEDSGPLYNRFVSAGITGKPIVNVELFGSWSKNPVKGVYPDYKKQRYCDEIDRAATYGGLSVFFHSNTWCQEPPLRYDLGGQGTSDDPGIRWYFDYLADSCYSQTVFSWQEDTLILDNGAVKRAIEFSKEKQTVQTRSIFHGKNNKNFISPNSSLEFSFEIDGVTYTGQNKWEYVKHVAARDNKQGEGVTVTIQGTGELSGLEIDINYLLYPNLPLIRKQLTFRNNGNTELRLESLDIENLTVSWGDTHSWVFTNYARQKHLGTYVGNWDDPLVVVHDYRGRQGIALGNEAPGVTKRTAYHVVYDDVSIGLTHSDENYAFRKWIQPNEEWTSPEVFIATYDNSPDASNVINSTVNDFTRRHMGIRLMEISEKPVFVYNTWNPFRFDINEQLVTSLVDAVAECGIEEFIIDAGWHRNFNSDKDEEGPAGPVGDWLIDETKFPNGLSPVFNYMKEKGLKPGLWISIASAHETAKVYTDHKEWFVIDKEGNPANLHSDWERGLHTSCFSTDWPDYIKSKIIGLVKDHGLEYTKLDLAVVTSAYVVDPTRSGCYATNHPYHKDHNESFLNNYQRLLDLFDDLHNEAPDLFIDCTFETVGKLQLIDYATVKHAEGNWLSNFKAPSPSGALRVRNLAWWRTPVIPAGACVIGNLILDSKDLEFDLLSLVGTLPIMLGDPRKLTDDEKKMLKSWSTWLREMQERYNYMVYRQDLPCFGEPTEGHWDGWARINTDTQEGGIIGVFRQGAIEKSRLITINWLKADQEYAVINASDGDIIIEMTGEQLKNEGFRVSMEREYQGKLFEIQKMDKREECNRVFMEEHTTWSFPGRDLKALISIPAGSGPFPIIMAIHGGGFTGGNCHRFDSSMHRYFLDKEIAFISVEYRLSGDGGKHPVAIRDCLHNIYWIKDHALDFHIDPERLTVMGSSAGAYLAMMTGLTCNDTLYQPDYGPYQDRITSVQAVISHAAMYDWRAIEKGESYIGKQRDDRRASPVNLSAGTTTKAFLLLGGEDDINWSPAKSARTMQKKLKKTDSHSELYLREETGHPGLYNMEKEYVRWAFEKIDPFLDKYSK